MEFYVTRDKDKDSLMHYGILGMRWGVRRYQNEDGSLTPAGEKRYNSLREAKTEQIKQETAGEYREKVKNENELAYQIGKAGTVTGYAAQTAQKRADKANQKLEKANNSGRSSKIQKAQARADLENKVAEDLWNEYNDYVTRGEQHVARLIETYGQEKVKGLSYRTNKSKNMNEPDKLLNEKTSNWKDYAKAAAISAVETAVFHLAGVPLIAINIPKTAKQQGNDLANARRREAKLEQKRAQLKQKQNKQSNANLNPVKTSFTDSEIKQAKKHASESDLYDLEFLERVQNKTYATGTHTPAKKKRMLNEYDKYLSDPMTYRPPEGDEE